MRACSPPFLILSCAHIGEYDDRGHLGCMRVVVKGRTCCVHPCAGMTQEELEPLNLVHSQKTALLQILLQLKRLRLVMRGAQRTYAFP